MSAINANIVVDTTTLTLSPSTTSIGVTVDPINLSVSTTSPTPVGGNIGELQYNVNGVTFGGVANTSVANGNVTFTNLANVKIDGGTNAYYLQTDGTGNLTWAAGGTPTGNGVPSGANTQIQVSDGSGSFASGTGFTFDNASNVFSTPGNINGAGIFNGDGYGISNIAVGNIVGLSTSSISNGTSNVDIATVDGNIDMSVGAANVAVFSTTGAAYPGVLSVNGNITAKNDITAEAGANLVGSASLNVATANSLGLTKYNETNVSGGTVSGTITPDASTGTIYKYTLNGAITLNSITNVVAGTSMTIILTQDATGTRTLTSTWKFANGEKTLSTIPNYIDIISVFYDGTDYYAVLTNAFG